MTERPTTLDPASIRRILAGEQVQLRRPVKLPKGHESATLALFAQAGVDWSACHNVGPNAVVGCPFGQPGDRLWVREQWAPILSGCGEDFSDWSVLYADDTIRHHGEHVSSEWEEAAFAPPGMKVCHGRPACPDWHTPAKMPRWASRLVLEITAVRVERLQVISEEDARAEGVSDEAIAEHGSAREAFRVLWDSINGKRAPWASNPWVWVEGLAVAEGVR